MYEIRLCVDLSAAMIPNREFGRERVGRSFIYRMNQFSVSEFSCDCYIRLKNKSDQLNSILVVFNFV